MFYIGLNYQRKMDKGNLPPGIHRGITFGLAAGVKFSLLFLVTDDDLARPEDSAHFMTRIY